jgi:citrate lyase subunit beta/citryl-CoA lyase
MKRSLSGTDVPPPPPRSLFFVPGSRSDMIAKLPRWPADLAVVDLEDAVAAADKDSARSAAVHAIAELGTSADVVLLRINPSGSRWFADDLDAAAQSQARGVVLPKFESADEVAELRARLPAGAVIVVGLETARGVADCRVLLEADVDAAYFGAEDYIADTGGYRTDAGTEVLYARSHVLLGARLAGVAAIDQAVLAIRDDDRFVADAEAGKAIGYTGKICVHPRQVELAHQVFTPSAAEIDHARAVLQMAESGGVGTVDEQMVDDVHIRMAQQTLARVRDEPE